MYLFFVAAVQTVVKLEWKFNFLVWVQWSGRDSFGLALPGGLDFLELFLVGRCLFKFNLREWSLRCQGTFHLLRSVCGKKSGYVRQPKSKNVSTSC